jgi:hypothetical protein
MWLINPFGRREFTMAASANRSEESASRSRARPFIPTSKIGRWSLGLSVLGITAWFLFPLIFPTMIYKSAVTNRLLVQFIGLVLLDFAAVLDLFCLWRMKEHSISNILATAITFPMALFFTCILMGEALSRL